MTSLVENNNANETAKKMDDLRGRKAGSRNQKTYHWEVCVFDKETNTFKEGKFCSIKELNEKFNLSLNSDYVRRIMTNYRADLTQRNKQNSFIQRWGHIKIKRIHEHII